MNAYWFLIGLIVVQRLAELVLAQRNTARLMARGGVEHGRRHYPLIVILHVAWITTMIMAIPPDTPINAAWLALFAFLQVARVWVIHTLGPYWTTRIITIPVEPLVRRGPYKFVKHPNYLIVSLEIAAVPMIFGAWEIALVFSILNALVLSLRIRVENCALADRMDGSPTRNQG